jgi:hypothetical protein
MFRCGLCDRYYHVPESTLHYTNTKYRVRFCRDCTQIIENSIRKLKVALRK